MEDMLEKNLKNSYKKKLKSREMKAGSGCKAETTRHTGNNNFNDNEI